MKKIHNLYADFETTNIDIKGYDSVKDYYEKCPNPKNPKIYSWMVLYSKDYKVVGKSKHTLEDAETKSHFDISGESFLKYVESLDKDSRMYFNNSKGFDGHFIIPLLDKAKYKVVTPFDLDLSEIDLPKEMLDQKLSRIKKVREIVLKSEVISEKYHDLLISDPKLAKEYLDKQIKRRWNKLLPYEYSMTTNGSNQIFEIKIGLPSFKTTKGIKRNRVLEIRDNLLLFPSSIAKMGSTLVKHYLNHFISKGLISESEKDSMESKLNEKFLKKEKKDKYKRYDLYKSIDEFKKDGKELEYLKQDVYILYSFQKLLAEKFPSNTWKLTIGATSYNDWRNTLGKTMMNNAIKADKASIVILERGAIRIDYEQDDGEIIRYNTKQFQEMLINKILPTKWLDEIHNYKTEQTKHNFIYQWFHGGQTHVNEAFRGRLIQNATFLDINSSYPYQMVKDVFAPIGYGMKGEVKGYDFKFYTLKVHKKITNETGLPFLHNIYADKREYLKTLRPNTEYKLTSISLPRFLKYYNPKKYDYTLKTEYSFKQIKINKLFGDYINELYKTKEQADKDGDEATKFISKMKMNSLFGKFGTRSERESKLWNQDDLIWEGYTQEVDSNYYLPLAIAITELAQMQLVDSVDDNYKDFVYCDTDSLLIQNFKAENYKNIELHKSALGKWDIEYKNVYGIVRRPKQYMLLDHNDPTIIKQAYSGINFNRWTLDDEELAELEATEREYWNLTLNDFVLGKKITKQLAPQRILGHGVILEDVDKSIKPIWEYDVLTEQKFYGKDHFLPVLDEIAKLERIQVIK